MTHDTQWTDKVVAVTGGNSGIGLATARRLAACGARIALVGRDPDSVASAGAELPGSLAFTGDVTDIDDLDRWYGAIAERWTGIDALVISAGVGILGPMETFRPMSLRGSPSGASATRRRSRRPSPSSPDRSRPT